MLTATDFNGLHSITEKYCRFIRNDTEHKGILVMPGDFLVITSVMENGEQFRPADWTERLSSTLASFQNDRRLRYAQGVQPCIIDGEQCLLVARWLESVDRNAFDFVMDFARTNQLKIQEDRRTGERAV